MNALRILGIVAVALGLVAYISSYVTESSYSSRSKLVQRVEKNEGADLFGESGTNIGSPQKLIVDDTNAFTGKQTPEGAEIVDEGYLKEHAIYPLQMQTVAYLAGLVRIGSIVAVVLGGVVWIWSRRRIAKTLNPTHEATSLAG